MTRHSKQLRNGDLVEMRSLNEIARTLKDGALDDLPFMAEMLEFQGQRLRVSRRAKIACYAGGPYRGFNSENVVTLDGVRCSGAAHAGCQKACLIFWREEWLRKVENGSTAKPDVSEIDQLQLRSVKPNGNYHCQASELFQYTHVVGRNERLKRYFAGWRSGNYNLFKAIRSFTAAMYWWVRGKLFGSYAYAAGTNTKTPVESLNLQPGEWVQVKPLDKIRETLDPRALNRGLYFSIDMRHLCGRKLRVRNRLDKMIEDDTGQMRQMRNTVCLEGTTCGCSYSGLGMADCARCEFTYWREIWLQRCEPGN